MTSTTAHAYTQDDETERSLAYMALLNQAYELHTISGIRKKDLQEALAVYNSQQDIVLDEKNIEQVIATVCDGDPPEEEANLADELETAILEQDQSRLFACAPYLAQMKRDQPFQFGMLLSQIKEAFGKTVDYSLLGSAIANANRAWKQAQSEEIPDVADIARAWASQNRQEWAYDHQAESWRHWNGSYWELSREKGDVLDHYVVNALQESGKSIDSVGVLNCFQRVAAAYTTRIFTSVEARINFENGTLDAASGQLEPHNRDDGLTYMLPYCYDPRGTHPHITHFLEQTIPDAHSRIVYMIHLGLALLGDTDFHKFLVFIGPPRSGKSTLLGLANALCGAAHTWDMAGPSLFARDLEGKRSRARWNTGRVVCVDELPAEAFMDEELLKAMTAHSGVEQRAIGKDERLDNRWLPKLMMSTNDTPHYKDTSGAVKQRALVIECPNGPRAEVEQDAKLFTRHLIPEIGAFAATCLSYARAAQSAGYYPRSAKMKAHLDRISSEGNPLRQFIEEECVLSPGERVSVAAFHIAYKDYCTDNGNRPLAKNKMSMAINDMHLGILAKHMRLEDKLLRGFEGIRLRSAGEERVSPVTDLYENDPLLTVVNGSVTVDSLTVNSINEPVEQSKEEVLTMLTVEPEKKSIRETSYATLTDTQVSPIRDIRDEKALTSLTGSESEPVEPVHGVNRDQNDREPGVNSTVNTPKRRLPLWLIPGTPEWNKQVERNGIQDMLERRAAALRENEGGEQDVSHS